MQLLEGGALRGRKATQASAKALRPEQVWLVWGRRDFITMIAGGRSIYSHLRDEKTEAQEY